MLNQFLHKFKTRNKSTFIHIHSNRNYLLDNSLEHWQEQLDPASFFRVSRTFIIHVNTIKDIIAYSNIRLRLVLQSFTTMEIIVSRERAKEFKSWIDR